MARPGPEPKARPHGAGSKAGFIDVENVPYSGPGAERDLPPAPGMQWFPQVEAWWEIIRVMPHCYLWEPSDWLFAIETAVLKNNFMAELLGGVVHTTMATEIRRREDQMGTTMEARRKLGIRYVDPATEEEAPADKQIGDPSPTAPPENVKDINKAPSRRSRLAG